MKQISRKAARDKFIDSMIASLGIEKLTPSETVVQGLRDCLAGKETTDHVLAAVMLLHVKVRRN